MVVISSCGWIVQMNRSPELYKKGMFPLPPYDGCQLTLNMQFKFIQRLDLCAVLLSFASVTTAAPLQARGVPLPPANTPPSVPIGQGSGQFAHVDGRLFNIDGQTQYFAGNHTYQISISGKCWFAAQEPTPGGSHIWQAMPTWTQHCHKSQL